MAITQEKYRHIAFSLGDISLLDSSQLAYERYFLALKETLLLQAERKIPVFTFFLLPEKTDKTKEYYDKFTKNFKRLFDELAFDGYIAHNKVKIAVLGKWYKLPSETIESIKNAIELTKDYDSFFLNFCINYDGQEEILDACKLIAIHVKQGNLDPEMITKEAIEEHTYSSYFMPPDLIIAFGKERKLHGLLLWDSADASIYFVGKEFGEGGREEVLGIVDNF